MRTNKSHAKLYKREYVETQENEFMFDLFFAGLWVKYNHIKLCKKNEPIVSFSCIGKESNFLLHNFNDSSSIEFFKIPSNINELIRYNRRRSSGENPEKYLISKVSNNADNTAHLLVL